MKRNRMLGFLAGVLFVFGFAASGSAALIDRGGGFIYDTDLNITWLQDANLAATNTFGVSGINPAGWMTWYTANNWISAMNSVNYLGYSDWRLPTTVDGPYVWGYDGTTTGGYNITTSEMGHLFYTELGNQGWQDTSGNLTGCSTASPWCLSNTVPFINLQPKGYWSGTGYAPDIGGAWLFDFGGGGLQLTFNKNDGLYAWVVRPGDVVVPEPATMLLLCTGLAGIVGYRKRHVRDIG